MRTPPRPFLPPLERAYSALAPTSIFLSRCCSMKAGFLIRMCWGSAFSAPESFSRVFVCARPFWLSDRSRETLLCAAFPSCGLKQPIPGASGAGTLDPPGHGRLLPQCHLQMLPYDIHYKTWASSFLTLPPGVNATNLGSSDASSSDS